MKHNLIFAVLQIESMGDNFYVKSPKSIAVTQTDNLLLSEEVSSPQIP